jgi:hypothetical protein
MNITIIISFALLATVPSCKTSDAQQQSPQKSIQTYTNRQFGITFNYPSDATVTEKQMPNRTDLGTDFDPGYNIMVSVPFVTRYGAWTVKGIVITIHNDSCNAYQGNWQLQQRIINGTTYFCFDPDWTETSGMSSMNKQRTYYYQSSNKCYIIRESINGLGNNERPSNATVPPDENSFLNSELVALDQIVSTLKIKQ